MKKFLLLLASVFIVSCGKISEDRFLSSNFSYDFHEPLCSTGKHNFENQKEYCSGLKDHSLNRNCAKDYRRDAFEKECPGNFDVG